MWRVVLSVPDRGGGFSGFRDGWWPGTLTDRSGHDPTDPVFPQLPALAGEPLRCALYRGNNVETRYSREQKRPQGLAVALLKSNRRALSSVVGLPLSVMGIFLPGEFESGDSGCCHSIQCPRVVQRVLTIPVEFQAEDLV
jgi:hypothetical protein